MSADTCMTESIDGKDTTPMFSFIAFANTHLKQWINLIYVTLEYFHVVSYENKVIHNVNKHSFISLVAVFGIWSEKLLPKIELHMILLKRVFTTIHFSSEQLRQFSKHS